MALSFACEVDAPPAARRRQTHHLLGMPMLCADGLSEAWLQKTCGELHWQALSQALGVPPAQWQDRSGRRVYAAFCSLALKDARLGLAQEDECLEIDSELRWLGESQAWSQHRLRVGSRALGVLDMVSAFVSRHEPGRNASVRRAQMPEGVCDAPQADAALRCADGRAQRQAFIGLCASGGLVDGLRHWTITPCPRQDFNGAGLLYFPSFSALADRALWQWGLWDRGEMLRSRECHFTGNVEVGEPVRVTLLADTPTRDAGRSLDIALCSGLDDRPLARQCLRLHPAAA